MNSLKISLDELRMIIGQQEIEKFDLYKQIVALRLENENLQKENLAQSDVIQTLERKIKENGKLE